MRAGRRRGFTPLPATYGCDGGGGAAAIRSLAPPLRSLSPPMGQAKGHQGLRPCFRFLGAGDRLGPDPPPIRGLSRVRAGRRRDGTSLSVTHRGGPGGRARL